MNRRVALVTLAAGTVGLSPARGQARRPILPLVPRPPRTVSGDATIRGRAGPSDIVITTTSRLAGAIHSVTWNGKEFIDSFDHGRQLQSAVGLDCGDRDFWAEAYNPTEAGSMRDHTGPTSTSQLIGLQAAKNQLNTITRMAYWLAPGEKSDRFPAKNTTPLSNVLLTKQVAIGYKNLAHAIDYRVTFSIPATEPKHTMIQFEAVTGYMPEEFSKFWTYDPTTQKLAALSDGPGEQLLPVVFSTANQLSAMGIWSPEPNANYGRFRFGPQRVTKWNCVFRERDPAGVKTGHYSFQMFVSVGSLKNVTDTINGLAALWRKGTK